MSLRDADGPLIEAESLLTGLNYAVYTLATLLFLSLFSVGVIAVIAEVKGTWHWMIHLESTISYMGVFVTWLLAALIPLSLLLFSTRWWIDG